MKIKYVGNINNWMDMRDLVIDMLHNCETELQFNKVFIGLIISVSGDVQTIDKVRKSIGIPKLSKKDKKILGKMFQEDK